MVLRIEVQSVQQADEVFALTSRGMMTRMLMNLESERVVSMRCGDVGA